MTIQFSSTGTSESLANAVHDLVKLYLASSNTDLLDLYKDIVDSIDAETFARVMRDSNRRSSHTPRFLSIMGRDDDLRPEEDNDIKPSPGQ